MFAKFVNNNLFEIIRKLNPIGKSDGKYLKYKIKNQNQLNKIFNICCDQLNTSFLKYLPHAIKKCKMWKELALNPIFFAEYCILITLVKMSYSIIVSMKLLDFKLAIWSCSFHVYELSSIWKLSSFVNGNSTRVNFHYSLNHEILTYWTK